MLHRGGGYLARNSCGGFALLLLPDLFLITSWLAAIGDSAKIKITLSTADDKLSNSEAPRKLREILDLSPIYDEIFRSSS